MKDALLTRLMECRSKIDHLDLQILEALNARTTEVEEIGRLKQEMNMAIYEPRREDQVLANVLSHNRGPLAPEALERIFERIIDEMRTVQQIKMGDGGGKPAC